MKPRYLRRIRRRLTLDLTGGPENTVMVAGSGRSGTTWLAELLNFRGDHRILFEPFFGLRVPQAAPFELRQYLRPGVSSPTHRKAARTILSGRIRHPWSDKRNPRLCYRQRMVKEIRAQLCLKWLRDEFGMPLVVVLRHPCAVALSQTRLGWPADLKRLLLGQPDLVADHLDPHVDLLRSDLDDFERTIALWCVETSVALAQLRSSDFHLCHYENLCLDPRRELERIFAHLGRVFDDRILDRVERPSAVASDALRTREDRISGWTRSVSPARAATALDLVDRFGLSHLYGEGPLPRGHRQP